MNIFKKIKFANKLLKLYTALKNHFEKNTISKEIKEKFEVIINNLKDLANIIPECKQEYNEIVDIIRNGLK